MSKQKDLLQEELSSFAPANSPGMRARLEAMASHRRGKALEQTAGRDGVLRGNYEVPDPTPMAPPVGYKPGPSIAEQIRQMVRSEHVRFAAEQAGVDTFEEADDFDAPDDEEFDPSTPYEQEFDPLPPGELSRRRQEEFVKSQVSEVPVKVETPAEAAGGAGGGSPPPGGGEAAAPKP